MNISDKVFSYIDNGELLTQSMLDNYQQSIIVIGDEKQAFIPIINSYIGGIGKSSYSYIIQMINDFASHMEVNDITYAYADTAYRLTQPVDIWGNTFDGTNDVNENIIPKDTYSYTIGDIDHYFAYAYVEHYLGYLHGHAETSSYSTYSTYTDLTYFTKDYTDNLYAITFTDIKTTQRYYSYEYIHKNLDLTVPSGKTISDALNVHDIDIIRFKGFKSGLYYMTNDTFGEEGNNDGTLFSTYFRGQLLGISSYAEALYLPRKINGTNFDGSIDITTTYWGYPQDFAIADYYNAYTGPIVSVKGDSNVVLNLPTVLTVDIYGNSTYATTSYLSNRSNCIYNIAKDNDYNYRILFTNTFEDTQVYSYSYTYNGLLYNPRLGTLISTYFQGWLDGVSSYTNKLYNDVSINGTLFKGDINITTTYWGYPRDIILSDYYNTYTYTNTSIDGGSNITLTLPENIHANLHGNADTSSYSVSSRLSNETYKNQIIYTNNDNDYYVGFFTANTYSYTYIDVNDGVMYNPSLNELTSTYMHAVSLFRGKLRAQDQWGTLGNNSNQGGND